MPRFIYFDLGNVLLHFSHQRMCAQIAALLGADAEQVRRALFDEGLVIEHESGRIDGRQLHQALCTRCAAECAYDAFALAASDIFWINAPMLPLLAALSEAGWRLGLLSNINDMHWEHILRRRYGMIPRTFDVLALSFELGAMKPEPAIFQAAAALSGVAPAEIFYTDDIAGHVAGAREAGFDAVQFTGAAALAAELRKRGVEFNH